MTTCVGPYMPKTQLEGRESGCDLSVGYICVMYTVLIYYLNPMRIPKRTTLNNILSKHSQKLNPLHLARHRSPFNRIRAQLQAPRIQFQRAAVSVRRLSRTHCVNIVAWNAFTTIYSQCTFEVPHNYWPVDRTRRSPSKCYKAGSR